MQRPRKWCGSTLITLVLTFAVRSSAHEGRRSFLDVQQQFAHGQATPFTKDLLLYQQFPTTTTGYPATTDAAQLAAYAATIQAQQAAAAQAAVAAQTAAAQQAALAAAPTTPAPVATPPPGVVTGPPPTGPPPPGVLPGAAPVAAPAVAPIQPTSQDAAAMGGMSMPDVDAKDLLPMTAETDPEAAERLAAAAKANAAPAGPEAAVIAEWAERFGKYSMDATVAAMRNVVGQIAREKAEEVISNVFASKYPNLHVAVLPPMPGPGPAPGPAPALAPAPPGPAM